MGSGTGDEYASDTCQEGCFTYDLAKLIPEHKKPKNGHIWVKACSDARIGGSVSHCILVRKFQKSGRHSKYANWLKTHVFTYSYECFRKN